MTKTLPVRVRGRPRTFDREKALITALNIFWERGYEPASIADLCAAMGINPPSLYKAFGNKATLFLEAVTYYEETFWDETWDKMVNEPKVHTAIKDFFDSAAEILTSPEAPCGCLVVLAAINVSSSAQVIIDEMKKLRQEGKDIIQARLQRGVDDGELSDEMDIEAIALSLNTLLEGMSIQAHDGMSREKLQLIAKMAVTLLPFKTYSTTPSA